MSSIASACCAAQLALLACSAAHAQALEPPEPPVAPAPTPASTPPESPAAIDARASVDRAKDLVDVGNYGAALGEYMHALELLEGDPRRAAVLNNIAVCYERTFRYDRALQYYEAYLLEADASAEDRAQVERIVMKLRQLLGTVRISGVGACETGACEIWIDDRKLEDAPIDIRLPAGFHVIEVRARGYEPERRELRVAAGVVHELHIELQPIDTYRGLHPAYFWTGVGLTAAAAITGTALGIAALSEHEAGERDAERDLHVDGQDAKDLALQADIAFGAGIAFGVGTTVLSFLTDWGDSPERQRKPSTALGFGISNRGVALSLKAATP